MADTIREQIIANIKTTLEGITTGAGYNNTLKSVYRDPVAVQDIAQFPAAFILTGTEDPVQRASSVVVRTMNLTVEFWVHPGKELSKAVESMRGDIQKAMVVDPRRAALAQDTLEGPSSDVLLLEEIPFAGSQIGYSVPYRTKIEDPFTAV